MGERIDVEPGDLRDAAHDYHKQEQRTKGDLSYYEGAAKLHPDVWGNLPESDQMANDYEKFYNGVLDDMKTVGQALHSFAKVLNEGAKAYEKAEEASTVKPGDTLSGIAKKKLGDANRWPEIADKNPHIKDPDLIYPGDKLKMPEDSTGGGHHNPEPKP